MDDLEENQPAEDKFEDTRAMGQEGTQPEASSPSSVDITKTSKGNTRLNETPSDESRNSSSTGSSSSLDSSNLLPTLSSVFLSPVTVNNTSGSDSSPLSDTGDSQEDSSDRPDSTPDVEEDPIEKTATRQSTSRRFNDPIPSSKRSNETTAVTRGRFGINNNSNAAEISKKTKGVDLKLASAVEENESACCECQGSGELICCDTCIRAYHLVCVPCRFRPIGWEGEWSCPVCQYCHTHEELEKRRGVLLRWVEPLGTPPEECNPKLKRVKTNDDSDLDAFEDSDSPETYHRQQQALKRAKHSTDADDSLTPSHHHYLIQDIQKRRTTSTSTSSSSVSDPSVESSTSGRLTRRQTAAELVKESSSDGSTATSGTSGSSGRMNVGGHYQVPAVPMGFLEFNDIGCSYESLKSSQSTRLSSECRLLYSSSQWSNISRQHIKHSKHSRKAERSEDGKEKGGKEGIDGCDTEDGLSVDNGGFSDDGDGDAFVDSEAKLREFCEKMSRLWPTGFSWPYSSEYAYKILFYTKFNSETALRCLEDPTFDFVAVCDPPMRPYFNKWRPRDKRGCLPVAPFPPPHHIRSGYGSVGARTRQQTLYGR